MLYVFWLLVLTLFLVHFNLTAKGLNIPHQLPPGISSPRGMDVVIIVINIIIAVIVIIIIIISLPKEFYISLKFTKSTPRKSFI